MVGAARMGSGWAVSACLVRRRSMSLRPRALPEVPERTAVVARAAAGGDVCAGATSSAHVT